MEPAVAINPPALDLLQSNAILNGRNTQYSAVNFQGTLSIKCVLQGQAIYEAAGGRFAVTPRSYLLLNNRQTYTMTIDSQTLTETFCVFFRPSFAERILHNLVTPADRLLDEPSGFSQQPVSFFENLYPHDAILTPHIQTLYTQTKQGDADAGWFEERFYLLVQQLLYIHRNIRREIATLPAQRAATRVELYRRLHRAHDFMEASQDQPLPLERIAEVAWLSPYHFLRLYKQVFGVTPHQSLTQMRLETAKRLLLTSETPIAAVGLEAGWDSHSAFSRAFRQTFGVSPEAFRRCKGILPAK
jgi:AraC-like DNA-binding protein